MDERGLHQRTYDLLQLAFDNIQTTVVKHLVHAFHNACHLNDTREKESANDFSQRYTIINSSVFNDLMLFCLKNLAKIFDTHLKRGEKANAKDVEPTG